MKIDINIPPDAEFIIETLKASNHKAYIVGGCVRDSIMGRVPADWDITTSATPCEIKELFTKTIDTGIKHGTITVVINGSCFEVTTFRQDGEYADNRHPSAVNYTKSIVEDLSRRDFTINAIAYNKEEGLLDPFSGAVDIQSKTIRTVGQPDKRFNEDALRMLRAVRFSAQLCFEAERSTLESILSNAALIKNISAERIRDELTKILLSDNPDRLWLIKKTNLMGYIMPEFLPCFDTPQNNPYHVYNVAEHIIKSIQYAEKDKIIRWTMLLHDIGKPYVKTTDKKGIDHFYGHPFKSVALAGSILRRLRFDTKSIHKILKLVELHDIDIKPDPTSVRKAVNRAGSDLFEILLKVYEADKRAQTPDFLEERLKSLKEIRDIYLEIMEKGQCVDLKGLAVTGDDLVREGFEEGIKIKNALDKLLADVLNNPELNRKDILLNIAKKYTRR
ncbi:MAG: HD domain-containing protein [Bacillota bacterium]|nr:HD domain-containing protein [Bacillota bacterium]